MNYEERVLAYFDILGFSALIRDTIDKGTKEENVQKTDRINTLFDKAQELKLKNKYTDNNVSSRKVSFFSDSFVISYLQEEAAGIFNLLTDILFFCITILQEGYLIRGAIKEGKLHHCENSLYGPAMLDAHNMEEKIAFYPRIIFEKKIINIAEKHLAKHISKSVQLKAINSLVQKDFDGLYYLDYFSSIDYFFGKTEELSFFLKLFKKKIIELQKEIDNDISIKSKYLWLKEKYNEALKEFKRKYLKEKIKNECRGLYDFLINEEGFSE